MRLPSRECEGRKKPVSFTTKKPVTLEDIDQTLSAMLGIMNLLAKMNADMSDALGQVLLAVTKPADDESGLEAILKTLVAQGDENARYLRWIANKLRDQP